MGWQIVTRTAADTLANRDPAAALWWSSDHPAALITLADQMLTDSEEDSELVEGEASDVDAQVASEGAADPGAVENLAKLALQTEPLNVDALRLLGLTAEARGDYLRAESLMKLAAGRSPRDIRVQSWLFNQKLFEGDYENALTRADAILRAWPEMREYLLPILVGLASDPVGRPPLIALLQSAPPWRSWFTGNLPQNSEDVDALHTIYSELQSGPTPPATAEVRAYLQRLVALGDYPRAYATATEFVPPERLAKLQIVENGDFSFEIDNLPFHWVIANARGAETEIVTDDEGNRALRVRFHNIPIRYQHLSQLLLLRPGHYELSGILRANALRNARGMRWSVSCAAGKRQRLGETERVSGTQPRTRFTTSFEVPEAAGCVAQVLRLELAARVTSEEMVSGEIWYDDLQIAPAPMEETAAQ